MLFVIGTLNREDLQFQRLQVSFARHESARRVLTEN